MELGRPAHIAQAAGALLDRLEPELIAVEGANRAGGGAREQRQPATRAADAEPPERGAGARLLTQGFVGFTPNQYLTAYGFPRLIRQDLRGSGERIAVVETGGFQPSDITTFARCFQLPIPHLTVSRLALRTSCRRWVRRRSISRS